MAEAPDRTAAPPDRDRARADGVYATVTIILGAVLLAGFALREYIAPDYRAEQVVPFQLLADGGFGPFLDRLPGYPGAMLVELVAAAPALALGAGEETLWRIVSIFGAGVLAAALLAARGLLVAARAPRGALVVGLAIAVASPTAYWALRIGHPEEVMSTGLLVGATVAAALRRPVVAGLLLGLATGKAWPLVAALPVLALLLPDRRRVLTGAAAAAGAALLIHLPLVVWGPTAIGVLAETGNAAIFNTGHVFWFFGDPIASSTVLLQEVPQPRVGPGWAGSISHPLVLGVGMAIGGLWALALRTRLAQLRAAGDPAGHDVRDPRIAARLASAALLAMAAILLARCFLDTWNVPYYMLPALVCGTLGELLAGRRPLMSLVATGLMWRYHAPGDATIRTDPDIYTAVYLGWVLPLFAAYLHAAWRGLLAIGAPIAPSGAPTPGAVATAPGAGGPAPREEAVGR